MFYGRRSFRVGLPLWRGHLGRRERPFYVFLTLQHFDTAKTQLGHAACHQAL